MAMMVREKRLALVAKMESREGKNTYTQSTRRSRVDSGYSDCSSLVHWVYKEVLGINIGDDTVGQIRTKKLTTIDAGIRDGIPDEKKLLPGDLLFFRGSDTGRKSADYVGHVEMYVGNGELSGHGFGIGPVRKNMAEYCRARRERSAPAPINNRGLICVRRALPADNSDYAASSCVSGRHSFFRVSGRKSFFRVSGRKSFFRRVLESEAGGAVCDGSGASAGSGRPCLLGTAAEERKELGGDLRRCDRLVGGQKALCQRALHLPSGTGAGRCRDGSMVKCAGTWRHTGGSLSGIPGVGGISSINLNIFSVVICLKIG